jgi:hypothetical protein
MFRCAGGVGHGCYLVIHRNVSASAKKFGNIQIEKKIMEDFIGNLEPMLHQLINLFLIILILAFVFRPLLNYLAVNRKIEYQKRILKELKAENGIFEDESTDIANNEQNSAPPPHKEGESAAVVNDFTPEQAEAIVKKTLRNG